MRTLTKLAVLGLVAAIFGACGVGYDAEPAPPSTAPPPADPGLTTIEVVGATLTRGVGDIGRAVDDMGDTNKPTAAPSVTLPPELASAPLPPGAVEDDPPVVIAVFARVESLADCAELQGQFETAFVNGERARLAGNLGLANLSTRYMTAAHERLDKVGCYQ